MVVESETRHLIMEVLVKIQHCRTQKGADEGSETRSSLMWETVHIIEQMGEWKPKVVIWENVKNVLSKHMKHNFDRYLSYMQMLGYTNNYEILNAMDFGLPQARSKGSLQFQFLMVKHLTLT